MAEKPPEKPSSLRQRGVRAARRVTDPVKSAAASLTGKSVEEEVSEYTETFTQVALGLHEDMSAMTRRVGELEAQIDALKTPAPADVTPPTSKLPRRSRRLLSWCR